MSKLTTKDKIEELELWLDNDESLYLTKMEIIKTIKEQKPHIYKIRGLVRRLAFRTARTANIKIYMKEINDLVYSLTQSIYDESEGA